MNKTLKTMLAVALVLALVLSLGACKKKTVEDYLSDPDVMAELESSLGADGEAMQISASGNQLKYVYTFTEGTFPEGTDLDDIADSLAAQESTLASSMAYVVQVLNEELKIDDASVLVVYQNYDGQEIYSKEFFGE